MKSYDYWTLRTHWLTLHRDWGVFTHTEYCNTALLPTKNPILLRSPNKEKGKYVWNKNALLLYCGSPSFLWTCLVVVGYFTRFVHWHEKRESRTTSRKWLTGSLQFWCQHQKQPLPYLFLGSPYFLHTPLNLEILEFWIKVWKIRKQFEVLRSLPSPSKNCWVNKYGMYSWV